jgi:hypothetical protein
MQIFSPTFSLTSFSNMRSNSHLHSAARFAERFRSALRHGLQNWCAYLFGGGTVEGERETQIEEGKVIHLFIWSQSFSIV